MKLSYSVLLVSAALWSAGWQRSGETVIDMVHALQWQDSAAAAEREGVWRDADKYCKSLELGGFYDWRLPTRKELQWLLEAQTVGRVELEHSVTSTYWNSEVCRIPINAWALYWGNGYTSEADKCDDAHVRCVRDR